MSITPRNTNTRDQISARDQRFADWRWTGFSAQMLVRRTELSATSKLSSGDETPPITNVLLCPVIISIFQVSKLNYNYADKENLFGKSL
jgi:hypothetical protein